MKKGKKSRNMQIKTSEELRFENEFLKLKLQAEFGASPIVVTQVPPEVENFFLKNIFKVERDFKVRGRITVFNKLGKPETIPSAELDDVAIEKALVELEFLLKKKGIFITFAADETHRSRYSIITEKIFQLEVDNVNPKETQIHFNLSEFDEDEDLQEY